MARAIKADPSLADMGLLLTTSSGGRGSGREAREAGFGGYLVKPVSPSTLRDVLSAVLVQTVADDVSLPLLRATRWPKRVRRLRGPTSRRSFASGVAY